MITSIIKVFSSNFIQLICSIIIGFFIPAILSINGYGLLKTYTLFVGYIGFLHLGFPDGMYLKYGGLSFEQLDKKVLAKEYKVFFMFQFLLTLIGLILFVFIKNDVFFILVLTIVPANGIMFYKKLYQSTGQFKKYSQITSGYALLYLLLNLLLFFLFHIDDYKIYCYTTVISYLIILIILSYTVKKELPAVNYKGSFNILKQNINSGFLLLLGNLSLNFFYAIDRWFVKIFYTLTDFSYYSFAVSMLNIIVVMINSIAITFYNFLCKNHRHDYIITLKNYLIIIGSIASGAFFILKGIVELFLSKYIDSLDIIAISFASFPFMIIINSIHVNLFKIYNHQRQYFVSTIGILIVSTILNLIMTLFNNVVYIALATTISYVIWYIALDMYFQLSRKSSSLLFYLVICFTLFITLSNLVNWWMGFIIYYTIVYVLITIIFKAERNQIIKLFLRLIRKIF